MGDWLVSCEIWLSAFARCSIYLIEDSVGHPHNLYMGDILCQKYTQHSKTPISKCTSSKAPHIIDVSFVCHTCWKVQGTTQWFGSWNYTRKINTPVTNGGKLRYYSTGDLYVYYAYPHLCQAICAWRIWLRWFPNGVFRIIRNMGPMGALWKLPHWHRNTKTCWQWFGTRTRTHVVWGSLQEQTLKCSLTNVPKRFESDGSRTKLKGTLWNENQENHVFLVYIAHLPNTKVRTWNVWGENILWKCWRWSGWWTFLKCTQDNK